MRLRTLPVSVAGVIAGTACAIFNNSFNWMPALCCLIFAVGAQIASNFANEYFDYRNGLDRKGREGFRRGVTEGDIAPAAMFRAIFITLLLSAIPGCLLIIWGGLWMIPVGICVALFAIAYSAGPYPLSHHGLGDVAVIVFFGLLPVILTAWLQDHDPGLLRLSVPTGLGVGLLAANVLIVNNYREADDDRSVGKITTVVRFGRKRMESVYLAFSFIGLFLLCTPATGLPFIYRIIPLCLIPVAVRNYQLLIRSRGARLNYLLKLTSVFLLMASFALLIESIPAALL